MPLRPARASLMSVAFSVGLLACEPAPEAVQSPVRQTGDDVQSSESIVTDATFHFDLQGDKLTGTAQYQERMRSGAEICTADVQFLGALDATEPVATEVEWSYRLQATGADASACRFPNVWLSFIDGSGGAGGVLHLSDYGRVAAKKDQRAIVLGSKVGKSMVTGEVVTFGKDGPGEAAGGYRPADGTLDFTVEGTTHAPTLYNAKLDTNTCTPPTRETDLSAVRMEAPFTGTVQCREDEFHADQWSVQLEAGQSLRAATVSLEGDGPLALTLLDPDGCRQVIGRAATDCPEGRSCSTVKQAAGASGSYTLIVENRGRCPEAKGAYELHIDVL